MNRRVLVLNFNYEPLNICQLKRAIILLLKEKAEVVEYDSIKVHSEKQIFEAPSIIKLLYLVKKPRTVVKLSRRSILARDNFSCQYCGKKSEYLTIDHIIPKRLGGKSSWENLVSACRKCNAKKADKTLEQANMHLIKIPRAITFLPLYSLSRDLSLANYEQWKKYL